MDIAQMDELNEDAFCEKVKELIAKESISTQETRDALYLLSRRELTLPLLSSLILHFTGAQGAKKQFLYPVLLSWHQKESENLRRLSSKGRVAYYQLLHALVGEKSETLLLKEAIAATAGPHEKEAIQIGLLLKEAGIFRDLSNELQKTPPNSDEELLTIQKDIQERKIILASIEKKAGALTSALKKASFEIPALFAPSESHKEDWSHVQKLLLYPLLPELPAVFESKEAFQDWVAEAEKNCTNLEKAIALFTHAHTAQAALSPFLIEAKKCNEPLFTACGKNYISFIEDKLFSTRKDCTELINKQKNRIIRLDQSISKQYLALKKNSIPYFDAFLTPDLRSYQDLFKEANALLLKTTNSPYEGICELTDETEALILSRLDNFLKSLQDRIAALVEKGKSRNAQIKQMGHFQESHENMLEGLKHYSDLKAVYEEEITHLETLSVNKQLFFNQTTDEIDQLISKKYELFQRLIKDAPRKMEQYKRQCDELYRECQSSKHTLKQRLFEIFTQVTPYPDIDATLIPLHQHIRERLIEQDALFFNGRCTIENLREKEAEISYDHDVQQLRNDLSFRATRLRELRSECHRVIHSLQRARRLLESLHIARDDPYYREIVLLAKEAMTTLSHLEDIFLIFKDSITFESVNSHLKRLWLQIEELQKKSQPLLDRLEEKIQGKFSQFKKLFLALLDDLEKVQHEKEGRRPNLFNAYEQKIKECTPGSEWQLTFSTIREIEANFSRVKPLLFFLLIEDTATRMKMLRDHDALLTKVNETIAFAKSMQYIKTFEEERVDSILEIFEHLHYIDEEEGSDNESQEAWQRYITLTDNACRAVQEEIFLDVGLLEITALLDIDQERLIKTIKNAVLRGKIHVQEKEYGTLSKLNTLLMSSEPSPALEMLIDTLKTWAQKEYAATMTLHEWLEELRYFCHLLFQAKAFLHASYGNASAVAYTISIKIRNFIDVLEAFLRKARSKKKHVRGLEEEEKQLFWIEECHNLKQQVEGLECDLDIAPAYEQRFNSMVSCVRAIPEIKEDKGKEFPLESMIGEIQAMIAHLGSLSREHRLCFTMHYIPGYLAFFYKNKYNKKE